MNWGLIEKKQRASIHRARINEMHVARLISTYMAT